MWQVSKTSRDETIRTAYSKFNRVFITCFCFQLNRFVFRTHRARHCEGRFVRNSKHSMNNARVIRRAFRAMIFGFSFSLSFVRFQRNYLHFILDCVSILILFFSFHSIFERERSRLCISDSKNQTRNEKRFRVWMNNTLKLSFHSSWDATFHFSNHEKTIKLLQRMKIGEELRDHRSDYRRQCLRQSMSISSLIFCSKHFYRQFLSLVDAVDFIFLFAFFFCDFVFVKELKFMHDRVCPSRNTQAHVLRIIN